jgi:predicted transposase YbfD/YdcC
MVVPSVVVPKTKKSAPCLSQAELSQRINQPQTKPEISLESMWEQAHTPEPEPSKPSEQSILHHFGHLLDPRVIHLRRHLLSDILVIGLCAVLGDADSWNDIERFGDAKRDWFARFLQLPNGIPNYRTFNRVFSALDPVAFQDCFLSWINGVCKRLGITHLQIDGKAHKGTADKRKDLKCLHTVSLWASDIGLTFGQVACEDKSNEITAIPKLLELMDLERALVSVDAMGCQKKIATKIRLQKGDYLLSVKGNQETLYNDIKACFQKAMDSNFKGITYKVVEDKEEKGHGRREQRVYTVIYDPTGLSTAWQWKDLKAIVMVYRERQEGAEGEGKYSDEVSYYITSSDAPAEKLATGVRSHWGIENKVHWILDVVFREDDSRARAGNASQNLGWLRRVALALLKQDDSKDSIKGKRRKAGWDNNYLDKLLGLLDPHLLPL